MKQILTNLYSEYGRHIDSQRAIPSENDCLKPVERRLLTSIHEIAPSGGKLQKSAKIVGHCIGNYHAHGDQSAYESLVNLVNRGLVQGQGNWGRRGWDDSSYASMRYTECKEHPILNSMISELLPFTPRESVELEPEPIYIPSPTPIGLIGDGMITGIGFNITKICRYSFQDLLKRLYGLLQNNNQIIIKPNFKDCIVKEVNSNDFEDILTKGEGEINVIPIIKTLNDTTLTIQGIHPIIGFTKLKKYNENYEEENNVPYYEIIDVWNYKSKTSLDIHIAPYRKKSLTEDFVKKIISLISAKIYIKINVVDEIHNTVKQVGIDHLLLQSYKKWEETYKILFEYKLNHYKQELNDINIIEQIRDVFKNTNIKDIGILSDEVVKLNNSLSKDEVVSICNKYRIKKLIESDIDKTTITTNISTYIQYLNTLKLTVFNIFKTNYLKI